MEIITIIAEKYGFNAEEALAYYETKTGGVSPTKSKKRSTEEKLKDDIAELKEKIPAKKGKLLEKAKQKLTELETKLSELTKKKAPAPAPAPAPVVQAPPPAPVPAEPAEEKRIKRMTPTITKQLKEELNKVGLEVDDKVKKEFTNYVNSLDSETWKAGGLADHIREFVDSKAPAKKELTVEASADPKVMSLDELKKISLLTEVDTPGVYWNGDDGVFVTGPADEEDEDMKSVHNFKDADYVVGEKSGRVYLVGPTKDVFAGFAGIGKFKNIPA